MIARLPAVLWSILLLLAMLTGGLASAGLSRFREAPVNRALDDSGLLEHVRAKWLPETLYARSRTELAKRMPLDEAQAASRALIELSEAVITPEWLNTTRQSLTREAFDYMRRKRPDISLHVSLAPLIERASRTLEDRLPTSDVFRGFHLWATGELTSSFIERSPKLPFGIRLSAKRAHEFILQLLPASWVARVIADELPLVSGYLTGEQLSFELVLPIGERRDIATTLISEMLQKANLRMFAFQHIINPAIHEHIPETVELPYGITLSRSDISAFVAELLGADWFAEREHVLFREALAYLTGRSETLRLTIPLASRKAALVSLTSRLVERKIDALLSSLPPCSPLGLVNVVNSPLETPSCRPPGRTLNATRRALGMAVAAHVESAVATRLPDELVYTEDDMRERIGEVSWNVIQRIREGFRDGLRVDHELLEPTLEPITAYTRPGVSLGPTLEPHLTPVRSVVFALRSVAWSAFGVILLWAFFSLGFPRKRPLRERFRVMLIRVSAVSLALVILTAVVEISLNDRFPEMMSGLGLPPGLLQPTTRAATLYVDGFTRWLYILWGSPLFVALTLGAFTSLATTPPEEQRST